VPVLNAVTRSHQPRLGWRSERAGRELQAFVLARKYESAGLGQLELLAFLGGQ
jgi:hypothetical protein